jgi:hypothetical protein
MDGVDHINVYSKGKTELGRMLSNFYPSPFTLREMEQTFGVILGQMNSSSNLLAINRSLVFYHWRRYVIQAEERLLRPKRQFVRLSSSLMLSFVFVEAHLIWVSNLAQYNAPRNLILWASLLSFGYALLVIWQLVAITIKIDAALKEQAGINVHKPTDPPAEDATKQS